MKLLGEYQRFSPAYVLTNAGFHISSPLPSPTIPARGGVVVLKLKSFVLNVFLVAGGVPTKLGVLELLY